MENTITLKRMLKAKPAAVAKAQPVAVAKAQPVAVAKAQPVAVAKAKPVAVAKAKPAAVAKAKPAAVAKAKPAAVAKAKPAVATPVVAQAKPVAAMIAKQKSYSQIGQDLAVLEFYKNKKNGYFVEIGASNGIELSNTYLLEKKYNWTGICVEPLPERFAMLRKNRPNSICCAQPVYDKSNEIVLFDVAHRYDLLSGISKNIDYHKHTVNSNKTTLELKTISLTDLLKHCNAPRFMEYLSLDTEGSELAILESLDFQQYKFGLIDVEHNYIEPRRSLIRKLLTENGYDFLRENKQDDCYKLRSL